MTQSTFAGLDLIEPLLKAIEKEGYKTPSPIQSGAIPGILDGKDLLGLAQTGTGKTAAFALPILQLLNNGVKRVSRQPRALILAPTRELAAQIEQSLTAYGRYLDLKHTVIYGGVNQNPQARALSRGVDILVATPGRLLDLMEQGLVKLNRVEILTLDEADRMLDMGFIHDVKKIVETIPKNRQTIFFSATMPPAVENLAAGILHNPISISINTSMTTAEKVVQSVMFVDKENKEALLHDLLKSDSLYRVLVFTRTKHRANRVAERLRKQKVRADAIHGNKSQGARKAALKNFISGRTRVLVATDVAARGIDVDGITHVINFELPNEPESYVHRIGRTARAGADGIAISFCDREEKAFLGAIERTIKDRVKVDEDQPFHSIEVAQSKVHRPAGFYRSGQRNGRGGPRGNNGPGKNNRFNSRRPGPKGKTTGRRMRQAS